MDVNAVWVPAALEALRTIRRVADSLGLPLREHLGGEQGAPSALEGYIRNPPTLDSAIAVWRGARWHFEVRLEPEAIRRDVERTLDAYPEPDRTYWRRRLAESGAAARPLTFLAVALDDAGVPVPVANTDPATMLFLEQPTAEIVAGSREPGSLLALIDVLERPYPVGLFVPGLGPLVANDAYADTAVQARFRGDLYHSPRVVWGREVNLLLLGVGRQIAAAYDTAGELRVNTDAMRAYVTELRGLLERTTAAVEASALRHNELWSYRIEGDTLRPVRYGASSDIQLWNVTDLAVRFLLDGLPSRE
jgi:hypothetical protein